MQLHSIIISVLYNHFNSMKEKGRKVIPWFQTISVISFSLISMLGLVLLLFFEFISKGQFKIRGEESPILISFILLVIMLFILIKNHYFNSNKHILYLQEFHNLTLKNQKKYSIIVLASFIALPFLLLFIVYIFDKRKYS